MWGLLWKQPGAPSSRRGGLLGWLARLAWAGLLLWLVLRKFGLVVRFRNPVPLCGWRFTTTEGLGVGWADDGVAAHYMVMYLNQEEQFALESPSIPYSRLFAFETYSIWGQKHGVLRDAEIVAHDGPNVYSNTTAAANGEKQGAYRIHITPQGNRNLTNELKALGPGQQSGFFVLVFRLVDVGDVPHPRAPLANKQRGAPDYPERWGWAPPPNLLVRRVGARRRGKWREIPACEYQPTLSFEWLDRLHDRLPSLFEVSGFIKPNRRNNMHLQRAFKYNSNDVRTLGSAADVTMINEAIPNGDLWARVSGKLPRTPRSLYAAPYIANASAYDVRYVAFTSGSRAFPLKTYSTLTDKHIRQHYQAKLRGPHEQWDGQFVIWVGPEDAPVPQQALQEDALIMYWGENEAGLINHPILLVSQRMATSQLPGFWDDAAHPVAAAAADVVADQCPVSTPSQRASKEEHAEEEDYSDDEEEEEDEAPRRERVCCGDEAPGFCYLPEYLHLNLRHYYPAITFFVQVPQTDQGPAQLRKLAV